MRSTHFTDGLPWFSKDLKAVKRELRLLKLVDIRDVKAVQGGFVLVMDRSTVGFIPLWHLVENIGFKNEPNFSILNYCASGERHTATSEERRFTTEEAIRATS